eukprot:CAMPEP_0201553716 /NCGR_PEP_ID=MMETSP0173_2-20130828/32572_1 /ASSEMBLY_ACC=CAM_ASM_000268 /TAXON_ID=218659 /ORGANISM="Vexillifera sp., Strain DIVA3 564/2" /LENGTH=185 /DNA_ID=CAMNT_0047964661 /DNA_START=48 /DNA_END=605 /DNA_ORIENTATION=-
MTRGEYTTVIVGAVGVGKSALTIQFINEVFVGDYDPTIEDSYRKQLVVDNMACLLTILDTAGSEEFHSIRDLNLRQADGCVVTFSITDKKSYTESLSMRNAVLRAHDCDDYPTVYVATKSDLEEHRQVSKDEALAVAKKWNAPYIETSAKTGVNVQQVFHESVRTIRALSGKQDTQTSKSKCSLL